MIVTMNKFSKLPNLRLSKQSPIIAARTITLCLSLLLVWALGRIAWIWVENDSGTVAPTASFEIPNESRAKVYQINQLLDHNFFGNHQKASTPSVSESVSVNAPKTKLNLTLVGVVASSDPDYSLAVIASSGSQQVYEIGEKIKNHQATLRQVLPDRVLLRNNGRDEILMLDGVPFEQNPSRTTPPTASAPKPNKDQFASIKAEILKNPQQLLKYITLSQQKDGQGITGYRIGPGSDSRFFAQSGLINGDLVVNINGADLRNPAEMTKIWQNLSDTSEINMTVIRDGQEHNVQIGL